LINGNCPCARGGVWLLSGVNLAGIKTPIVIAHLATLASNT